jgi:twinkle protein
MPPRKPSKNPAETNANLVLSKQPCIGCSSSDAFAVYDDGHGFCFAEGKLYSPAQVKAAGFDMGNATGTFVAAVAEKPNAEIEQFIATAKPHPIQSRGLTLATTKRWNYLARRNPHGKGDRGEHLALYRRHGKIVAVKVRTEEPKDFRWVGKAEGVELYGQHMWGEGGKYLTITEGELDALSVGQAMEHKYPVVSVPGGAAGAAKAIAANLEYVNSFGKVVFMFDMDEPGQEAARECAAMIAPGKAFLAHLPAKDPNELLVAGKGDEIVTSFWNAAKYTMGGVVDARTLSIKCKQKITVGRPYPWKFMTKWTFGRRPGETVWWGGGIGLGKSDVLAQIVASTIVGRTELGAPYQATPFGFFNYEAADWKSKLIIAGKIARRRFHIPDMPEFGFVAGWDEAERDEMLDLMDTKIWDGGGRLYLNEAGFDANWDSVVSRMRYLNKAEDVHEFAIDNIAAICADMAEDDERRFLDQLARQSASLSQELDSTLHFVSHLNTKGATVPHEEGGRTSLGQFRGSKGLGIFANYGFGIERNKQAETDQERRTSIVRVLKERLTGLWEGHTAKLIYDPLAGTNDEIVTEGMGI